ncbi:MULTISPECIES: hypothetical protein [Serratia]|uniref:Lipoprotein n=1 Tax=Serratia marcescens TaxID=615 RepID=A0ABD5BBF9_SERMA|nr:MULTISPECIES: hypothetical protein [Serratia]AUU08789.1 hypothetical protein MC51_005940 [Serratia marcescens]EGS5642702.1 hypothetical protein [Serratia marcescens]EIJ9185939.1 hypothetical protein [Serratia marcescens]EIY4265182.1 hypothetical protein [Serratia marcescens]ELH4238428.1 hypothetical protein [Serratia marcescens]
MMIKPLNRTLRMGLLCLLALSAAACQNQKSGKPAVNTQNQAVQAPSEEALRKQREAEQLQQCQQQLGALRTINEKQYQRYKQAFDSLMSGASQYANLRARVNGDTQETVDALYRYKVNYLCAGVNQAVLTGLADRGEQVK